MWMRTACSHRNIGAYATVGASATVGQVGGDLTAPTITTQPLNATVALAQTTTFLGQRDGIDAAFISMAARWRRHRRGNRRRIYYAGGDFVGQRSDLPGGISNSAGSVTSSDATLTVNTLASGAPAPVADHESFGLAPVYGRRLIITILANATPDSDGTILKVEFFNGGTKLGEDSSSPYALTWSGVAAGSYSLTARAIDNLGEVTPIQRGSASVADAATSHSPSRSASAPTGLRIAQ